MRLRKLSLYTFGILGLLFSGCEDDNSIGTAIQPEEDLLQAYHNHLNVQTSTIVSDSLLSKADYLLFGRFSDQLFGEINAEYMTQVDARIGGIILPDTTVVTSKSSTTGILNTLLKDIDGHYGEITSIKKAKNFTIDSVFYYMQYNDGFWGDSTALQAVQVYELNKGLDQKKYFTNVEVSDYCDQSILLGEKNYQIRDSRIIKVPLSKEFGERISSFYINNLGESQNDFNQFFPGVYVKHAFNEGTILQVEVSGLMIFYHYDADIYTSFDGRDTMVTSQGIETKHGVNPLVTSYFLSGNKTVKRANAIKHEDWSSTIEKMQADDANQTFAYTPAGVYSQVSIPYGQIIDSVKANANDTTKVKFNSVRLVLHRKEISDKYLYSGQLLLIQRDSIENFFYNNKTPDGITSFTCSLDEDNDLYAFNITRPTQNRINGIGESFADDMVLVPVVRTLDNYNYYYKQQLWMTATGFYGSAAADTLKPCIDIIYTKRQ